LESQFFISKISGVTCKLRQRGESMQKLQLSGKKGREWGWISMWKWKSSTLSLDLEHLGHNLSLQLLA